MKENKERLINMLLEQNDTLAYSQARTWIELLWDDFESTYAKAGAPYMGEEMAERIVTQWIMRYGSKLHEFVATNTKYAHLLNQEDYPTH